MTDTTIAQGEPILVAIDIAKARHEVLIAVPGKKRRRRLTVLNLLEDFNRLIAMLLNYDRPVRVAFEATGNYHRALAYRLGVAGFDVKLVSSVALARTREALNNSWDKNDPKDAQVILHMMQIGNEQFYHDPILCGTNDLQELSKTHDIVSRSKTELWHRVLTHYCPCTGPRQNASIAAPAVTGSLPSSSGIPHRILSLPWSNRHSLLMLGRWSAAKSQKNVCLLIFIRQPGHR